MRNAILPPSMASQFYNNGNNEVQTPYMEVLMQMEGRGNVHGDAFSLASKVVVNNDNLQLIDGAVSIPYQSYFNPNLQDYQSGTFNRDNHFQQSMSLGNKLAIPNFESVNQNGRKRTIEVVKDEQIPLNGTSSFSEWKRKNKRKKLSSFEQQQESHQQINEALTEIKNYRLHTPVRRTQKLSDKITALQKLVSPYGKTDTASVLQEASLYIKLIHEQIQNLFQMLSSSYNSLRAMHPQVHNTMEIGKKQPDLRSRGLCLVPISFTQTMTKEDRNAIDSTNNSLSRKNHYDP